MGGQTWGMVPIFGDVGAFLEYIFFHYWHVSPKLRGNSFFLLGYFYQRVLLFVFTGSVVFRKEGSKEGSKEASKAASKEASKEARKQGSKEGSKEARQQGSKAARQEGRKQGSKEGSKEARQQGSKEGRKGKERKGKEASKQASKGRRGECVSAGMFNRSTQHVSE